MTQLSNRYFAPTVTFARWAAATALLGAGTLSCSTPANPAGTGGQGTGGAGGTSGASSGGTSGASSGGTGGAAVTGGTGGAAVTGGTGGAAVTGGTGGAAVTGGTGGAAVTGGTGGAAGDAGAGGTAGGGAGAGAGGTAGGGKGGGGAGGSGGDAGWTDLFNGMNLNGWTPSQGHAALYAVGQVDGGPVIHVYPTQADQSNQPQAALRTNASYSSYVFHAEYKWGTKRFADRSDKARDNGICFHICNNPAQVWPESIEFQLGADAWPGDWVSGNIFMLVNKTRAQWPYTTMNGSQVFSETGTRKSIGAPMSYYKALVPSPNPNVNDAWNIVELTVHGAADAEYKVNGTVVNRLFNMECDEGSGFQPLTEGPIALQAEFAEIYFRNVRIRVLQ